MSNLKDEHAKEYQRKRRATCFPDPIKKLSKEELEKRKKQDEAKFEKAKRAVVNRQKAGKCEERLERLRY